MLHFHNSSKAGWSQNLSIIKSSLPQVTVFILSHSVAMLHPTLFSTIIFIRLNLLTVCLLPSHGLVAQSFLFIISSPILPSLLMRAVNPYLPFSSIFLVNYGTLTVSVRPSYEYNFFKRGVSNTSWYKLVNCLYSFIFVFFFFNFWGLGDCGFLEFIFV